MRLAISTSIAAACTLVLLATAAPATAKTIYVKPSGNDSASGTSVAPLETVGAALARARGGDRVQLAPGDYPRVEDRRSRTGTVEVYGYGPAKTRIAGLEVSGGEGLSFNQLKLTAPAVVQDHPITHEPAERIEIDNAELVASGSCLTIKGGAQDVVLTDSKLHDCHTGIAGPGNAYVSRRIRIERNVIERMRADGIQFGTWSDVRIAKNVIRDIRDPAGVIHNDGIQLTGRSSDVTIEANKILRSTGQLLLVQDAIGSIDGLDVINNVLAGASAVAMQSQGATNARYLNNTIAKAKDGGMWFRAGYQRSGTRVLPADTIVANNVSTTIRYVEGASAGAAAGNVVLTPAPYSGITVPEGTSSVPDMGFVAPASDDYRLLAASPVRALGSTLALPPTDITGAPRTTPVPGAYN